MFFPEMFENQTPGSRSAVRMTSDGLSSNTPKAESFTPSEQYPSITSPAADLFQLTSIVTELAVSHQELHDRTHQAVDSWEMVAGELMKKVENMSSTIQEMREKIAHLEETQNVEEECVPEGGVLRWNYD
ncbi:hypothetical protein QFC24_000243 [Naganishia onofrii]|uniref:Uncharacterized protein n=1 Tax=Naganishia onofrii TaxID=1851511 RepID=A0ACC2XVG6_9TREE|nr:hypothetical protein QFC24_000243 [Naganishia onofrii]